MTTSPGLALRAHRIEGIVARELPGSHQHIYAATYGEPPDPPATIALLAALAEAACHRRARAARSVTAAAIEPDLPQRAPAVDEQPPAGDERGPDPAPGRDAGLGVGRPSSAPTRTANARS